MKKKVHDDSNRPDINFIRMSLSFKNFRGNVVGSSTYSFLLLLVVFKSGGQSEISKFDFHVFVEEQVSQLQTA